MVPSERQVAWQELEFYAFIHFSINTFTDQEWGDGKEDPALFHPSSLDARQWVTTCKSAGMKGLILTCKHHDGFCLWPSLYTEYSVKNSPWQDGKGDVVREVADACREEGMRFGIYLSPWDRHEPTYGDSPSYNTYFRNQLRELLTNYGDLFCIWFDGACGEGPNGKRQEYDWESYYALIRELQPDAVISVCGPDVRWCGNEAGHSRESEWSVVPYALQDQDRIQAESQQSDDREFATRIDARTADLGSREVIQHHDQLVWYPAEVDTSIRPGWFYHASQDHAVRSLNELLHIYYGAVGGNAALLLNIPPDRRGWIHEHDAERLRELGRVIRETFRNNMADGASIQASATARESHPVEAILHRDKNMYWHPPEGVEEAVLTIDLQAEQTFDRMILMEHIRTGQRIERFQVACRINGEWQEIYQGTVVGYKRICCFPPVTARELRVTISESRCYPTLVHLGVYKEKR